MRDITEILVVSDSVLIVQIMFERHWRVVFNDYYKAFSRLAGEKSTLVGLTTTEIALVQNAPISEKVAWRVQDELERAAPLDHSSNNALVRNYSEFSG